MDIFMDIYGYMDIHGYIHGYPRKICGYGYGYRWQISYPRQAWKNVTAMQAFFRFWSLYVSNVINYLFDGFWHVKVKALCRNLRIKKRNVNDCIRMGRNVNVKSHSRLSLILGATVLRPHQLQARTATELSCTSEHDSSCTSAAIEQHFARYNVLRQ